MLGEGLSYVQVIVDYTSECGLRGRVSGNGFPAHSPHVAFALPPTCFVIIHQSHARSNSSCRVFEEARAIVNLMGVDLLDSNKLEFSKAQKQGANRHSHPKLHPPATHAPTNRTEHGTTAAVTRTIPQPTHSQKRIYFHYKTPKKQK